MKLHLSLVAVVIALFALSLSVGPAGFARLWHMSGPMPLILWEIRLPRAILALFIGAGLGLSGAAMQGYLRNPMAEPGILGVSGMAALGAVISIHFGLAALWPLALPFAALFGAVLGVALILALSGSRGGSVTLILAGIAISALAGAFTSLVLNLAPNPWAANEIVFWMMGSLADRSWLHVALACPFILIGTGILLSQGRALDALTLGEDAAESLGLRLSHVRLWLVFGTAAVVGAGVAVAGAVGFVGLVVPHLLRPLVAGRPSVLLIASALGGAGLVLAADVAVRVLLPTGDLKLGVLTALVGAPLFLHLIWKMRRGQI
jgi:iron complex transport system permease protein